MRPKQKTGPFSGTKTRRRTTQPRPTNSKRRRQLNVGQAPSKLPKLSTNGVASLTKRQQDGVPEQVLQVLGCFRFIPSHTFTQSTGLTISEDTHYGAFDVVLSDGAEKIKCLLAPSLTDVVFRGLVVPWSVVVVEKWTIYFDELNETQTNNSVIIIEALRTQLLSVPEVIHSRKEGGRISWSTHCNARHEQPVPLVPGRENYLPLHNDDCLQDALLLSAPVDTPDHIVASLPGVFSTSEDPWVRDDEDMQLVHPETREVLILKETYPNMETIISNRTNEPLVGQVMRKGPILHYGMKNKDSRFPLKCEFVLGDSSKQIRVILWNHVCLRYFCQLVVGDVIAVEGYRIKRYFSSYEVSVNASSKDNRGKLFKLQREQYDRIPDTRMLSSSGVRLLSSLIVRHPAFIQSVSAPTADDQEKPHFHFAGAVQYASNRMCIKHADHGLHEYRWLLVRDHLSDLDVAIQVYSNSQTDAYLKLHAGDMVHLTELRSHVKIHGSNVSTSVHFSSSRNTVITRTVAAVNALPVTRQLGELLEWYSGVMDGEAPPRICVNDGASEIFRNGIESSLKRPSNAWTVQGTPWDVPLVSVKHVTEMLTRLHIGEVHFCRVQGTLQDFRVGEKERPLLETGPSQGGGSGAVVEPTLMIRLANLNETDVLQAVVERDAVRSTPPNSLTTVQDLCGMFPVAGKMPKDIGKLASKLKNQRFVLCLELRNALKRGATATVRAILEPRTV